MTVLTYAHLRRYLYFGGLVLLAAATTAPASAAPPDTYYYAQRDAGYGTVRSESPDGKLRYPIALETTPEDRLLVAFQRSGSLMLVDPSGKDPVVEQRVGLRLSALAPLADHLYLVTDEEAHELLLVEQVANEIRIRQRLAVAPYPVGLAVSKDASRVYVSSLWSRRITVVDCDLGSTPDKVLRAEQVLDIDLAPRCLLLVEDDRQLIVADSFAGKLGIFQTAPLRLQFIRDFPGHNIRGMTLARGGETLLVAHQMLNELAHTVRNDVHWGLLMSNDLRWLKLEQVLTEGGDLYKGAHMHPLGEAGSATGDPSALRLSAKGEVLVALGGVGELAMGQEEDFALRRIRVGKRPTAISVSNDGKTAYVANCFDDSISVVNLAQRSSEVAIPLGEQRELSLVEQGERLFHDASLSHDSWMSCNSCHTDGHTNGLMNDNFSDDSFGAPKRVLSLRGRKGTEPFAWNGNAPDLATQIRKSILNTMQGDREPTERQVSALAAFVESLEPPPSVAALRGTSDPAAIERGRAIFHSQKCHRCHTPPLYTSPKLYDVGLEDKFGNRRYNPPTLRGVGQRGPYFHDNRAESLDDVFRIHGHQLRAEIDDAQLSDLLHFLQSL